MTKTENTQLEMIAKWTRELAAAHLALADAVTEDERARIMGDASEISMSRALRLDAAATLGMCQAMLDVAFLRAGVTL